MNIGFYFHITADLVSPSTARIPAWAGIYIAELARQAGTVTLYVHDAPLRGTEDLELSEPAVRCVNLGPLRSAPSRTLLPGRSARPFHPSRDGVDVMLIRGPTPLLPHLARASDVPTALYLQGDLMTVPLGRANPRWRNVLIDVWRRIYTRQQRAVARQCLVLVNSPHLAATVTNPGRCAVVISSLVPEAVFEAWPATRRVWGPDSGAPVRVLYTGRLVEEKGLFEAIEAVRLLRDRDVDLCFQAVGEAEHDSIRRALETAIHGRGLEHHVSLKPFVAAGPRLWDTYRNADMFLFPSRVQGEGVPHSLLEAMAAGLPVVATTVGGIARFLRDGEQAVLVEPGSPVALADGMQRVIRDRELRSTISHGGWLWASEHSLERSCAETIRHLDEWRHTARTAG